MRVRSADIRRQPNILFFLQKRSITSLHYWPHISAVMYRAEKEVLS